MTAIPEVAALIQAHMIKSWPKKFVERIDGRRVLVIPRYVKPTVDNGVPNSDVFTRDEFIGYFTADPAGSQFRNIHSLAQNVDRVMLIGMNHKLLTKYEDAGKMLIAAAVFNLYASFIGCTAVITKRACSMIEADIYNGKYSLIRYFTDIDYKVPRILRNGRIESSLRDYWENQLSVYWSYTSCGNRVTMDQYNENPQNKHVQVLCDIKFGRPYGQLVYHYLRCNLDSSNSFKYVAEALESFFTGNDVQFLSSPRTFLKRIHEFVNYVERIRREDEEKDLRAKITEELTRQFEIEHRKPFRKPGSEKDLIENKRNRRKDPKGLVQAKGDTFKFGNNGNNPGKKSVH